MAAKVIRAVGIMTLAIAAALAQGDLVREAETAYRAGRYAEAAALFAKAAGQGDARAQTRLGYFYLYGQGGIGKDDREAARLFKLAGDQGNAEAQSNLGVFHLNGLAGMAVNEREAARLFKLSADQQYAQGQFNLANVMRDGKGVPQDYARAIALYGKAADQGLPEAAVGLGAMYATGLGVPRDDRMAMGWFRKAAEQGDADAQYRLGIGYLTGRGVQADGALALSWLKKSGEQGNAEAQFAVGAMYASGSGVPVDLDTAKSWYRKAAAQGQPNARKMLAHLGEGGAPVLTGPIELLCDDNKTKSLVTIDPAAKTVTIHGGAVIEYKDGNKQYVRVTDDAIEFGCKNPKTEQDILTDELSALIGNPKTDLLNDVLCLATHRIDRYTWVWMSINNGNVSGSHAGVAQCSLQR